jgi:hypothetical protein
MRVAVWLIGLVGLFAVADQFGVLDTVVIGLLVAVALPGLAAWFQQPRRSGPLALDLGRAGGRNLLGRGAIFACVLAFSLYGLRREVQAPQGSLANGVWAGTALVLIVWTLGAWLRGLSIHQEGVLTPECLIEWPEISTWSCDGEQGVLSIGVRGAGVFRAVMAGKPISDTVKTWRIRPEHVNAVKEILTRRVRAPVVER